MKSSPRPVRTDRFAGDPLRRDGSGDRDERQGRPVSRARIVAVAALFGLLVMIAGLAALPFFAGRTTVPAARVVAPGPRVYELPRALADAGYEGKLAVERDGRFRLDLKVIPSDSPRPIILLRMLDHGMIAPAPAVESAGPGTWLATGNLSMAGRWSISIGDEARSVQFVVLWRP